MIVTRLKLVCCMYPVMLYSQATSYINITYNVWWWPPINPFNYHEFSILLALASCVHCPKWLDGLDIWSRNMSPIALRRSQNKLLVGNGRNIKSFYKHLDIWSIELLSEANKHILYPGSYWDTLPSSCPFISCLPASRTVFRHGHQLIFLMKVELFWYSEMKIIWMKIWTWECVTIRTFFSFKSTKIIQL